MSPANVIVAGESVGGSFAAAVSLRLRDDAEAALAGQVLIYPALDNGSSTLPSRKEFAGLTMTEEEMDWCWNAYTGGRDLDHDPFAAPLHAESLAGLPSAFIVLGGCDFLRDEGRLYAGSAARRRRRRRGHLLPRPGARVHEPHAPGRVRRVRAHRELGTCALRACVTDIVNDEFRAAAERARQGNLAKEREKLERQGKLFVRDRLALLLDDGSFVEQALLANAAAGDLPADGVVTGIGTVDGRPVCVMANDSTVKAGSWGVCTVEKIVRLTEYALEHEYPVFWLVDSAGARLTDQVELFPGRRGAGRIFYNQNRLSGRVPQICCLFGPSVAGGVYIPAFCDVVIMVEGNASMYLGSPRMVEMVVANAPRWRRWAVRGCTRPCPEAATTLPSTTPTRLPRRATTSRTCRRTGARRHRGTPPKRRPGSSPRTRCRRTRASPSTCTSSSTA